MTRRVAVAVASGLGCGFSPWAPGTVGSLAALLPGVLLGLQAGLLPVGILIACGVGLWAIRRASAGADHGWIVIDEVAGQWTTLLGLPPLRDLSPTLAIGWLTAALLLFRLLDITKPGPIGTLDRRHDAYGVMGDDMLAGLAGAALLALARLLLHGTALA